MKSELKSELNTLLQRCLKKDRRAQKKLYETFGPTMKMVCKRYLFDASQAEEVMNQGFLKVFTNLYSYTGDGNFEGWVRRIMVNSCLNENRKRKNFYPLEAFKEIITLSVPPESEKLDDMEYLLRIIAQLPIGYRIIFNMIEIEGYSHKEVSYEMGISEGASRARLSRSKDLLRQMINERINPEGIRKTKKA